MPVKFWARTVVLGGAGLALAVSLGGCKRYYGHQGYLMDDQIVDSIRPGVDNRASVERALGRPTFASQFEPGQVVTDESVSTEYFYVSRGTRQYAYEIPHVTDETVLRIQFDPAGNVVELQETGLERVKRIRPHGDRTPTQGDHSNLFNDIFGNIGTVGAAGTGPGAGPGGGGPGSPGGPGGN